MGRILKYMIVRDICKRQWYKSIVTISAFVRLHQNTQEMQKTNKSAKIMNENNLYAYKILLL